MPNPAISAVDLLLPENKIAATFASIDHDSNKYIVIRDFDHVKVEKGLSLDNTIFYRKTFKGSFSDWSERENQFLLYFRSQHVPHVVDLRRVENIAPGKIGRVETFDAGLTIDEWARYISPRYANGLVLPHPFLRGENALRLLQGCLLALFSIHRLGILHCDIKGDNICLPFTPKPFTPNTPICPDFAGIRLIDFSFSLGQDALQLKKIIPVDPNSPDSKYQAQSLKRALQEKSVDLLNKLDYSVDLYSLGFLFKTYFIDTKAKLVWDTPQQAATGDALFTNIISELLSFDTGGFPWGKSVANLPHENFLSKIAAFLQEINPSGVNESFFVNAQETAATGQRPFAATFAPTPITPLATPIPEEAFASQTIFKPTIIGEPATNKPAQKQTKTKQTTQEAAYQPNFIFVNSLEKETPAVVTDDPKPKREQQRVTPPPPPPPPVEENSWASIIGGWLIIAALGVGAYSGYNYLTQKPETVFFPDANQTLKTGQEFVDCLECPLMVVLPKGEFDMGSPPGWLFGWIGKESERRDDEGPVHTVTLNYPLAVGKFEVTFNQWDACVAEGACANRNPNDNTGGAENRPITNISWNDAKQYTQWLSKKTGKNYRLLSEPEWEYAARAGSSEAFSTGKLINPKQANFNWVKSYNGSLTAKALAKPVPVGSYPANKFGLHEMHGNVFEWVEDCYRPNYDNAPSDGSAFTFKACPFRVARGGSWFAYPEHVRSARRYDLRPEEKLNNKNTSGLRVALTLPPS